MCYYDARGGVAALITCECRDWHAFVMRAEWRADDIAPDRKTALANRIEQQRCSTKDVQKMSRIDLSSGSPGGYALHDRAPFHQRLEHSYDARIKKDRNFNWLLLQSTLKIYWHAFTFR